DRRVERDCGEADAAEHTVISEGAASAGERDAATISERRVVGHCAVHHFELRPGRRGGHVDCDGATRTVVREVVIERRPGNVHGAPLVVNVASRHRPRVHAATTTVAVGAVGFESGVHDLEQLNVVDATAVTAGAVVDDLAVY